MVIFVYGKYSKIPKLCLESVWNLKCRHICFEIPHTFIGKLTNVGWDGNDKIIENYLKYCGIGFKICLKILHTLTED